MAIQIKSGQQVTSTTAEQEVQFPNTRVATSFIGFIVTSGSVQVTVAGRNGTAVIGGDIAAFTNTSPIFMTVEGKGSDIGEGRSMYIKGSGTIVFFY